MTQFNPPPPPQTPIAYGYGGEARRANGPAIASLVLGILGCIPLITGLLAILFGAIGIRKTRDPQVGGKGLAIAGLILGILSVLGWGGFMTLFGVAFAESRPAKVVASQFLQDLSAGRINNAMANSTGFAAVDLKSESDHLTTFGPFQSLDITYFHWEKFNGTPTMHLTGGAVYAQGMKACTFDLVKVGGVYKVNAFTIQPTR